MDCNLLLSQNMKECIRYWEEQMNGICIPPIISAESFLADIITRLERSCYKYVDEKFVAEFYGTWKRNKLPKSTYTYSTAFGQGAGVFSRIDRRAGRRVDH